MIILENFKILFNTFLKESKTQSWSIQFKIVMRNISADNKKLFTELYKILITSSLETSLIQEKVPNLAILCVESKIVKDKEHVHTFTTNWEKYIFVNIGFWFA